ncbi:metal-dependent hydrolase [Desulfurispirillum indicum]|uniref:Membrane-bound metal-dependent hydrolase n=1 Tax=Desulfurispirillum indicum (strain ATCC BAA-1389 / DSM 22839 / S5) TaxID=653733 RepID=E6W2C5_DESIS|nr:metal-dependent hydrolase [Desulfurispirillum indicum]ADU65583.1 membrane-bound metal-dependent hydrolase [Desulfurispirillum indicum S5]UCZ57586.1 metal-dependent hydrolase [Desulfurispirillum indicum]
MAMFDTHLAAGTVMSGALATLAVTHENVPLSLALGLVLAGTLGSVLPDIDAPQSRPTRVMLSIFAMALSLLICIRLVSSIPFWALPLLYGICFLGLRVVLESVLQRFAVHRGIIHSIPAALVATTATAVASHTLLGSSALQSWWLALFVLAGFLIHLVMDEVYAVNISGAKLKRSFGSALKLYGEPFPTLLCLVVLVALWLLSPPIPQSIVSLPQALWGAVFH